MFFKVFINKDRESHCVKTHFTLLVDLWVCALLLFIYLSVYFFRVMVVHIHDFRYTRVYDIRQYNDISHCDYFKSQEQNYLVEIAYHQEKQGMLLQVRLYPTNKPKKGNPIKLKIKSDEVTGAV